MRLEFLGGTASRSAGDYAYSQWRIQDFLKRDAEQEVWGMEVPQWGPGVGWSPSRGLGNSDV